jgi:hypothetical protein
VDGSLTVVDGVHRVEYFVNDSAVYRLEFGREDETPREDGQEMRLWGGSNETR